MFISRKKYNELLKMCYYDKVTGAYNRNWFEKNYIENPVHKNISLAVIDINNLKSVNDSNGHWAGDELIKKVNDKLSQYATVVRWSGDEFFALLMQKRSRSLKTSASHKKSLLMHTNLTLTRLTLRMLQKDWINWCMNANVFRKKKCRTNKAVMLFFIACLFF